MHYCLYDELNWCGYDLCDNLKKVQDGQSIVLRKPKEPKEPTKQKMV